ncbi:MAG: chitobiase/beta-hexosaminidase C-terminal domain-containing protein [Bacteroidales bacterium]|nr:chitobiase/beta-hexosaminidase C-terminal domain-containing protein [Bacteroidales bacterium]
MRELYAGVSQRFGFGKLAKSFKWHSQKLRAVVAAMAMIFITAPFYGQSWNLVTDASDLSVGDSVIIVSGNYALSTTQNANNRVAVEITINGDDVDFDDETGVQGIKLVEGNVDGTFGFFVDDGYLYAASSSSNYLKTQEELDDNGSWLINIENGETTVEAQGSNTHNKLRKNSSSAIFSCYGSGQSAVTIYKYEEGGTSNPSISLTQSLADFSYNLNNGPSAAQSFAVSGSNLTADITVTVPEDADFELCITEDGAYTSSVTIAPSEGTVASTDVFVRMKAGLDAGAYNATVTIASTDATSKTISLTGSVVDPDAVYYTVVTEAPATDWTGEYLITYTNGSVVKALAGSSGTSTNYGTEEDVSEYLIGNRITANATTDAKKVTARSTSNGYTLYLENVGYLGWNSGNSLAFDEAVTDGRNEWTISVSDEVVSITNVGTDTRSIKYNSGATRFACYTSGQAAITLYKSPREVQELIANPTFNPAEGTFFNSVDVTLACETDGTTIYYTLDGSDPTDASTAYTEAIHITETATVKAIAIKNSASSEIVSATYTKTVATPVIAPEAGNYNDPQQITITCATDEAIIYYTTDGTDPTAESTSYTEPFTLSASATVKAIAIKGGMNDSEIASAAYTMPVFLENLSAVYSTANNDQYKITGDVVFVFRDHRYMFVKDATAGIMIFDNNDSIITTEYNEGDVISGGIMGKTSIFRGLYEVVPTANLAVSTENNGPVEPIVVTIPQMSNENDFMSQLVTVQNLTVTGIDGQNIIVSDGENTMKIFDRFNLITESDYAVDDVITSVTGLVSKYNSDYQIFPRTAADIVKREVPADPIFTPEAGIYTASVTVTLACETEGATIYYTLNDTDTEVEYTAPLTFTETTTIYAFAEKNSVRSQTVSATYTITDMEIVATPTITPNGGEFETSVEVTLACETADAAIHYTTDGTDPTAESTLYDVPFVLNASATVKAIAVKENMQNSAIAVATFTKVEPAVAVNYTRITSLNQLQDGDKVIFAARYDDDATHYYVAPTRIANKLRGVAVAVENDVISTDVDTIVWTLKVNEGSYRFVNTSNDTLGYSSSTNFSKTSNKDWTISEYTTIDSALVAEYTGYKITNATNTGRTIALNNSNNNVFGAYANSNAENNNAAQYNFALDFFVDLGDHAPLVATPTFSVPAGNYSEAQTVEILCTTEGATIRYTLDGTDPTEESAEYTAALTITEPTTVKAKAYKQDCIASGIAEAFYNVNTTPTITVDAETLSFENVNETKTVNVSSFNLTEDITVAVSENFTVDAETITMNTDATLTVTFVGNAVTNGTLTLTSGETEVTVALVATPLVASEGCYYPIADALTDWTGDYLITYTDLSAETINALNGIHENNYGLYENVYEYYAEGIIASNLNTEICKVTIEPTEEGKYSMYLNRNGYLGLSSDGNKLYSNSTFTAERDEWTITAENGVVTLTSVKYPARQLQWNNAQSGLRFACYTGGQTPVTLYKLGAVPAVATPVFTPVAGYYEEAQNVTITCATEGATIYYTTDGSTPTNESTQYTGAIAVSQNTTIKAIAILGDDESFVATARYTFPNFVENIAALYAVENTTDTYVLTGDVTFVYRNGKNMYVKDETAGLLLFDRNEVVTTEYTEGDVISGGITGTISMYHGMLEFIPTFNTAVSTQNTGAVVPTVITVEQLRSNAYVSQLVKVENVNIAEGTTYAEGQTGSNVTFSQNGSEALLRNSFKTLDMEIGDNTNWDITGFAAIYDSDIQIFPRDNDDVTLVTSVEGLTAEIAIYPNPTSNVINIAAEGLNVERVELANVDGQIVSSEEVASDMVTVSLEGQPAGMYFVRIYTANEVIVRKVTKF